MLNKRKYKISFKIDNEITQVISDNPEITLRSSYLFLIRKYGTKRVAYYSNYDEKGFQTSPSIFLDGKQISNVTRSN